MEVVDNILEECSDVSMNTSVDQVKAQDNQCSEEGEEALGFNHEPLEDEDNYGLEDLDSEAATDNEDCSKKQVPNNPLHII